MRASSPLLKLLNFAHAAVRGAGRLCLLLSNSSIDQKGWTPATYCPRSKNIYQPAEVGESKNAKSAQFLAFPHQRAFPLHPLSGKYMQSC